MPDDRIRFSELSGVLTIDNSDIIAAAVQNGASETGFSSVKVTIVQMATKVAEGTTFSNLNTNSKYIVPAINEIKELISTIPQFDIQVVQTLPETGVTGTVYLVPSAEGSSPNMYEEYLWVSNSWEKLGSASVDLSNYYNKTQINGMLADVFSSSVSYSVGDYVLYNNYLYRCIEATTGEWDSTKWSIVKVMFEIPKELNDLDNVNIQNPTHRQGLVYDNPSGKWINAPVGGSAEITTYDNTESGLSATNVQDAIDELEENIEGITEPQKTVSGSVVTFSDSLPNSPLIACKASIEATQSGTGTPSPDNIRPITAFDTVIVQNSGKNLIDIGTSTTTNGGVTFTIANGVISLSGTATGSYANCNLPSFFAKSGIKYTLSGGLSSSIYIRDTTVGQNDQGNGITFTGENNSHTLSLRVMGGTDATGIVIKPQIEVGESKTTFEPFRGSTHTIPLGQTVGRGTLNVTTGELTITDKIIDMGSFTWSIIGTRFITTATDAKQAQSDTSKPDIICEVYEAKTPTETYFGNVGITVNSADSRIIVYDSQYSTAEEFKTAVTGKKVMYELANPITVQLTPEEILTITENNISANSGDIEVTYRTPFYVSANSTSYDNSTSGLEATNVQEAIDELAYKDIISTLETGETTLTINDSAITTDSTIDIYTDKFGVSPTNQEVTTGQIVLTFSAQSADLGLKVRIS